MHQGFPKSMLRKASITVSRSYLLGSGEVPKIGSTLSLCYKDGVEDLVFEGQSDPKALSGHLLFHFMSIVNAELPRTSWNIKKCGTTVMVENTLRFGGR